MIDPRFLEIEEAFDSGRLCVERHGHLLPPIKPLIPFLIRSDWKGLCDQASELWQLRATEPEKAFLLQWLVGASEVIGDYQRRKHFLSWWKDISDWVSMEYCQYLKVYQEGLTAFFAADLNEADFRLRLAHEKAIGLRYPRGQMRCLFHLALICRDRGDVQTALGLLDHSLALAKARQARSWIQRIDVQRRALGIECRSPVNAVESIDEKIHRLEARIRLREYTAARALMVEIEKQRRSEGVQRKMYSVYTYLSVLLAVRGRERTCRALIRSIQDPVVKCKALSLKCDAVGLSDEEEAEISFLRKLLGINSLIKRSSIRMEDTEVCGIKIACINDEQVRSLISILLNESGPINKEVLCQRLWNFTYKPDIHDGRIYKLFHRTRKFFGKRDLIVNTYGSYQLNPDLLPARAPRQKIS